MNRLGWIALGLGLTGAVNVAQADQVESLPDWPPVIVKGLGRSIVGQEQTGLLRHLRRDGTPRQRQMMAIMYPRQRDQAIRAGIAPVLQLLEFQSLSFVNPEHEDALAGEAPIYLLCFYCRVSHPGAGHSGPASVAESGEEDGEEDREGAAGGEEQMVVTGRAFVALKKLPNGNWRFLEETWTSQ